MLDAANSEGFEEAIGRVSTTIGRITGGDAAPYVDCWAGGDELTLFGAWGPIEKGRQRITRTFEWVGERLSGPGLESEIVASGTSGTLGYTIGFERGRAAIDGGPSSR